MIEQNNKVNRRPDWDNVHKNYKECIKKKTIIPTSVYGIGLIGTLIATVIVINKYGLSGWAILPIAIFMVCVQEVTKREVHKDGYLEGYQEGYEQGRDDVLEIDDETRHFVDQQTEEKKLNIK